MKIACVLTAHLPIQVEIQRHGTEKPLLVTHPVTEEVVFAHSTELTAQRVQVGMSVHQARQLAPDARVVPADELTYHTLHGAMEVVLREFSLAIETVGLGEFLLDVRGLEPHYPQDETLAVAIRNAAQAASGLAVNVSIAGNKFVAQQAARSTDSNGIRAVAKGEEADCIADLPLDVLPNMPGEFIRRLHIFNVWCLGDLARLPKAAVLNQFGGNFAALYELACGRDPRPLNPDVPPLRVIKSMRLTTPVRDKGLLLNVVTKLARAVSRSLTDKLHHAEAIKLTLKSERGRQWEVGQALKPPTADETRLIRIAAQLLGKVKITAPIESVVVTMYPLRSWHLGAHQWSLSQAGVSEKQIKLESALQLLWHRFGDAVIRIAALLGPPLPIGIDVALNDKGMPTLLKYGGRLRPIEGVEDTWRNDTGWWQRRVRRDYFRVVLSDGSFRHIFQDLLTEKWYLDRAWLF